MKETELRKKLQELIKSIQNEKEKEPIEKEINKKLREELKKWKEKFITLKLIYAIIEKRCKELGIWEQIFPKPNKKESNIFPTIADYRKAELV